MPRIIDSHVHLIDPEKHVYPWMKDYPSMNELYSPERYLAAASEDVDALVFMEVTARIDQCVDEARRIDGLRTEFPVIKAVVARAPYTNLNTREAVLEELAAIPSVRGIRDLIQWEEPGYCSQDSYKSGVKLAGQFGLHTELCILHPQLGDVLELVAACPDQQFVLNHCGKPGIKEGLMEPWACQIKSLAAFENVVCKVSALLTEADLENWQAEDILPYIEHVTDCFGPGRLLFGGDWPVCTMAGSWQDWYGVTQQATSLWSDDECDAFYYKNAAELYRV